MRKILLPLLPDIHAAGVTRVVTGCDQNQQPIAPKVVEEQAWTVYLDSSEIVTVMTIGDYPDLLALGYLLNQNLLAGIADVADIEVEADLRVVVVRRCDDKETPSLSRRIRTSGCAEGTLFEHVLEQLAEKRLTADTSLESSVLLQMLSTINTLPSLYLEAGAIHGCVLCRQSRILAYLEDVGRHNAIDKIAGLMALKALGGSDCWFFTTGRLTTEMVLKTLQMEIPILVSRSGFTAAGVELAQRAGLTLIGRARGKRFQILSSPERIGFPV